MFNKESAFLNFDCDYNYKGTINSVLTIQSDGPDYFIVTSSYNEIMFRFYYLSEFNKFLSDLLNDVYA